MRKMWHFFVGLQSGLPSEVGVVKSSPAITAPEFLKMVKAEQLAGFEEFDLPIVCVYLEQTAKMTIGHGVGVHFLEVTDDNFRKFKRIRITRRFL